MASAHRWPCTRPAARVPSCDPPSATPICDAPLACPPPPRRAHQAWVLGRWWRRAARIGEAKAVRLRASRALVHRTMARRLAAWWQAAARRGRLRRGVLWWCRAARTAAWAALRREVERAMLRARFRVYWDRRALRHGLAKLAAHVDRRMEPDGAAGAARVLATAFLSSNAMLCRKWYAMSRQRAALVALRRAAAANAALTVSTGRARGRLAGLRIARAFRVWAGGAAAVNLWLRAAVARWARSQSRAIARWAAWAARWGEARALLLRASAAHRRRALVGAAAVWSGPAARRRRVMACAVRWRGAAAVKALRCWREAASSLSSAAAVMEVCAAAAAHAALTLAWAELWRRARRAARAEAGWRAHVGRRALRRWRAAAATLPIALRKRSGAVRNNAANAMRSDPATAKRRWAAREAARAMLTWRAWTREGRALALACARRAYARGYARHSPMKGVAGGPLPERRKEILLARRSIATN